MRIGIDAINLRDGGGVTHLVNILNHFDYSNHTNIDKIIVWGRYEVLEKIENKDWLEKRNHPLLNNNLIKRYIWIFLYRNKEFQKFCDILFTPGGLYTGNFRPYITMSRNMLLFDKKERNRLSFSLKSKLLISKLFQHKSLLSAKGIIFISDYANKVISKSLSFKGEPIKIVHGISDDFRYSYDKRVNDQNKNIIDILYVSTVSFYKHQCNVIQAVKILIDKGYKLNLHLVGGAEKKALKKMEDLLQEIDPTSSFVIYHKKQPHQSIMDFYKNADIFVYASTCENMPNILIEAMSASLPIACSNSKPMNEFLKDAGLYFNAEDINEIANRIEKLINDKSLRCDLSKKAYLYSQTYSWEKCAKETFSFIERMYNKNI